MTEIGRPERIRGCLVGGAVGDALGADVEFDSIEEIRLRRGPGGVTGYPEPERRGRITDDTQMSLFTAEGLIRADNRYADRGICNVPEVIHRAYLRWLLTQVGEEGRVPWDDLGSDEPSGWLLQQRELWVRRAPGGTCLSALQSGTAGTPTRAINDSKGCGGVMRVAPIGLVARDPFDLAVAAAAITHTHPTGYLAAGAFAEMISHVMKGVDLLNAAKMVRRAIAGKVGSDETVDALDAALELADSVPVPTSEAVETLGRGWVADEALAIALYCALTANSFREGVLVAVNHSGDSDSTGSMCGNLLGTALGVDSIPADFKGRLVEARVVDQVALDMVCHFVEGGSPEDFDRYPTW